jgi:hypothetical protein
MNTRIFDAFETRAQHVQEYMARCGQKYGMPCTCGSDCRCTTCEEHCGSKKRQQDLQIAEEYLQAALDDPTVARSLMHHTPESEVPRAEAPVSEGPRAEVVTSGFGIFGQIFFKLIWSVIPSFSRCHWGIPILAKNPDSPKSGSRFFF